MMIRFRFHEIATTFFTRGMRWCGILHRLFVRLGDSCSRRSGYHIRKLVDIRNAYSQSRGGSVTTLERLRALDQEPKN